MLRRAVFAGLVVITITSVVGCALITSVGDLKVVPTSDDGAASNTDGVATTTITTDSEITPTDDASLLRDVVTTTVDGCSEATCFDMPANFTLIAFGFMAKNADCPTGFGAPLNTVEGPTVGANACTCNCNVTSSPSCQAGTLTGFFSTNAGGTCGNNGQDFNNNNSGGCGTDGFLGPFGADNKHRYTPPNASGGACATSVAKDDTKLAYAAEGRVCQATIIPQCGSKICAPQLGDPKFRACIAAQGDVTCPTGFFGTKHLVGSSASFTCSPNGCTCAVTATCPGGTLNFYSTTNCTGAIGFSYAVNDSCVVSNANGASFESYRYVANAAANVACTKGGASAPSTTAPLNQAATVCCNE